MVPRLALLIVFLVLSVFALPVETRADDGEAEQLGAALDSGGPPEVFQVHLASALEQVRQEPPQLSAEAPGLQQADLQFDPRGHDKSSGPLANGALSVLLEATEAGIHGPHLGIAMVADSVRVEVLHTADSTRIRDIVSSFGGRVYGEVPGHLVEATVPVDRLAALEETEEVQYLRPPLVANAPIEPAREESIVRPASVPLIGEQVQKMNAAPWHNAGFTGQGVKVGIIDAFDENIWSAAQAAGEVPAPAGTFCLVFGQNCSVWDGASPHGVAVAEIIHEMAPAAQLYLAIVYTPTDIMAAVDYFASQGVQIISRSQTSEYDGPGDGTGPTAAAVDYAIEQGMIWLNAAGNAAGMGDSPGGYWRGNWSDPDGDGALNFGGDQELLPFVCGFLNGVRWSDWGSVNPTDYDVLVLDDPVLQIEKTASVDDQGAGAPPMESLLDEPDFFCADGLDIDFLVITLFNPANGTSGDILEFLTNTAILEFSSNPYSASGPMVDSFNGGMLAVGAIDPALGTTNAIYSSQGPTNDNRTKPDVSAAACVQSFSYFPDCFNGTSSATPAVAGAAALILGADLAGPGPRSGGLAGNPAALAAFIKSSTVERGVAGPDNIYGVGEVILGEPPDGTAPTPPPDGLVWGDLNCQGGANPVDALSVLRFDAGQSVNTNGCPHLGDSVAVQPRSGPPWVWGDVDCSGNIDPIDGLKLLRFDAGLSVAKADQNCPTVGDDLVDSGATATPTPVPTSSSPTATPTPAPTSATVTASPTVSPTPTAPPTATASPTPTASPTSIPGQPSNDCDDLSQPAPILDNDDQNPATLIFEIPGNGTILDLQLCVNINHTWVGDLFLVLEHEDTATAAIMMDVNPACDGNNVRVLLSDAAASFADDACSASPPAINGTLRPTSPLSVFDGESIGGTWVLRVFDLGQGDTGQVLGATIWSQTD